MALSEFVAVEIAYRALQPLDPVARTRVLRWLKDALKSSEPLPESAPRVAMPGREVRSPGGTVPGRSGDRRKERVYRRMPPVEEVMAAYTRIGTISGLATHFGVPRHTVQGWARRMRRDGHAIGRKAAG